MARVWLLIVGVAAVFTVFAIVDCALFDRSRVRGVPKGVWIVITFIPVIGGILWFLVGRGRKGAAQTARRLGPDDDPEFLGRIRLEQEQRERIRRLERELSELDDPKGDPGSGAPERDHPKRDDPERDDEPPKRADG